jgi:glycine betaine/proline transport system substrate-binding protein
LKAEENKTPFIGYAWQPWTLHSKLPTLEAARVKFPANDWSDPAAASGLTDYPSTPLQKLMSKKLNDANDPFTSLVKNFKWTNADQNGVAADLENGMTAEEAASKWIAANAATVAAWVGK